MFSTRASRVITELAQVTADAHVAVLRAGAAGGRQRGVGQQPAPRTIDRFEQCLGGDAAALRQQQRRRDPDR